MVNCLWDGRQAIDRAFGLPDDGPWLTRVKYGFLFAAEGRFAARTSVVITHGPFGDVVYYPSSDEVYASWYPACRVAVSGQELASRWRAPLDGRHDPRLIEEIVAATREQLDPFFPGLARLPLLRPLAGAIMARGESDIDRRDSGLHRRVDEAPRCRGGYYSLFTGKYTLAPLQAARLATHLDRS